MLPYQTFKYVILVFNFYGLPIYPGSVMKSRYIKLLRYIKYVLFSLMIIAIYFALIRLSLYEDLIESIFLCFIAIVFCIRTNISVKPYQHLLDKGFDILTDKDQCTLFYFCFRLVLWSVFVILTSITSANVFLVTHQDLSRQELAGAAIPINLNDNVFIICIKTTISFLVIYVYIIGQMIPAIIIIAITNKILLCKTKNMKKNLKSLLEKMEGQESLNAFRSDLRKYWEFKRESNRCIKLFIFIFLMNIMSMSVTFLSKIAISWEEYASVKLAFVFHTISVFVIICICIALLIQCDWCDREYEDLVERTSSVVGSWYSIMGEEGKVDSSKIEEELFLLHLELSNRPDTRCTVYGMFTLNRCFLLSFISATINFYVMTIQIRVANKQ